MADEDATMQVAEEETSTKPEVSTEVTSPKLAPPEQKKQKVVEGASVEEEDTHSQAAAAEAARAIAEAEMSEEDEGEDIESAATSVAEEWRQSAVKEAQKHLHTLPNKKSS